MVSVTQIRLFCFAGLLFGAVTFCADLSAQSLDTPMTRMRPIGTTRITNQAGPAVQTQFGPAQTRTAELRETDFRSPVRQTMMMQQGLSAPPLPNTGSLPTNPNALPVPTTLPANPPASDVRPVPQPQLNNRYATIDNCNLVTPASAYSAAFSQGCGQSFVVPQSYAAQPIGTPLTYAPPQAQIAAPAIMPGAVPGARAGAPIRSLLTFGQERFQVQVGQGILGQPTAYVPGQPLRNWVRYLTP